jgi:hypothetical protein
MYNCLARMLKEPNINDQFSMLFSDFYLSSKLLKVGESSTEYQFAVTGGNSKVQHHPIRRRIKTA